MLKSNKVKVKAVVHELCMNQQEFNSFASEIELTQILNKQLTKYDETIQPTIHGNITGQISDKRDGRLKCLYLSLPESKL